MAAKEQDSAPAAEPGSPDPPAAPQPVDAPQPLEVPRPPAGMRGTAGPLLKLISNQRIAFLLVGATNTGIGAIWYAVFLVALRDRFATDEALAVAALVGAHVAAVPCAFVLYRYFVFRVRGHVWRDLGRFELVNLTAFLINLALLPVLVHLGLHPFAAQLLIACGTVLISFFGHRDFSFRRKPAERPPNGQV